MSRLVTSRRPIPARSALSRREEGTVTLWALGLCVMLLFLGGISLDLWRVFSERRALSGAVDAAAIAGASGIDEEAFRESGALLLDPERAESLAWANLAAQSDDRSLVSADVAATPEEVTVEATGSVEFTLLGVLMPGEAPFTVQVTATARPGRSP